jgi:hypothetical protein
MFDISSSRMSQMQVHRDISGPACIATNTLNRTDALTKDADASCSEAPAIEKCGAGWDIPQGKHIAWGYVAVGLVISTCIACFHSSVYAYIILLSSCLYTPIVYTHSVIISSTRSLFGACATLGAAVTYQFFSVFALLTIHSHIDEETETWPVLLCLGACYSFLFTVCSSRNYWMLLVLSCGSLSQLLLYLHTDTSAPIALLWPLLLCVSLIAAHVVSTWSLPVVFLCNKSR